MRRSASWRSPSRRGSPSTGFLDSLATATTRPLDVVLADNGSTDGAPEAAAARHRHVRVPADRRQRRLRRGRQRRPGRPSRRLGAGRQSRHPVRAGRRRRAAGRRGALAAGGDRRARDPDARRAAVPLGARPAVAVHRRRATPCWAGPGRATPGPPATGGSGRRRASGTAGWLSGSCFLVDLEAFHSVGGFDPGYFMYFEDVDLAARLGERGWLHVYAPSAVVEHEGGHATSREPHRMQRVHHTSALRYLARRYPGPARGPAAGGAPRRSGRPDAGVLRERPRGRRRAAAALRRRAAAGAVRRRRWRRRTERDAATGRTPTCATQ